MGYKDPEKAAAYAREWRAKHVEKVREDDRKRREKERLEDPSAATRRMAEWRVANPEKAKNQGRIGGLRIKERMKIDPVLKEKIRGHEAKYLAKPGVRDKRNQYTKEWHKARRAENPEHYREATLKCLYGITIEQYDAMVVAQGGCCAICRVDKPGGKGMRWNIDHCHDRDQIRELLCHSCNTGLGLFKDDPDLFRAAAAYIERHQQP